MTTPINLTELREWLKQQRDYAWAQHNRDHYTNPTTPTAYDRYNQLLALIDTAEAAITADAILYEHMPEWYDDKEWPELKRLRETLTRYTQETP